MNKSTLLIATAAFLSGISFLMAQPPSGSDPPPRDAAHGPRHPFADRDRPPQGKRGGPNADDPPPPPPLGRVMPPPFLVERLDLSDEQIAALEELQAEVDAKLAEILTAEQRQQLRHPGPGGHGPGRGPGHGPGGGGRGGPDGGGRGGPDGGGRGGPGGGPDLRPNR